MFSAHVIYILGVIYRNSQNSLWSRQWYSLQLGKNAEFAAASTKFLTSHSSVTIISYWKGNNLKGCLINSSTSLLLRIINWKDYFPQAACFSIILHIIIALNRNFHTSSTDNLTTGFRILWFLFGEWSLYFLNVPVNLCTSSQ